MIARQVTVATLHAKMAVINAQMESMARTFKQAIRQAKEVERTLL